MVVCHSTGGASDQAFGVMEGSYRCYKSGGLSLKEKNNIKTENENEK